MSIPNGLSRKEKLDLRLKLVTEARHFVADAEKNNPGGQLRGDDKAKWEAYDRDIEQLCEELDSTPQQHAMSQLAKWNAEMDKDPGRITEPTLPGSGPGNLGGVGGELLWRGQPLDFEDRDMRQLQALNSKEYNDGFTKLLKRGGNPEALGMKFGEDAKGGVMASMGFVSQLIKFADNMVMMRRLGTVIPTNGAVGLGANSWDTDPGDADWTPEVPATAISEDDSARMGRRELLPHGFAKLLKMSNKLRRHHPMLQSFLIGRLGYKAAITEEKAFMTGSGAQQPLGVFTLSDQGITTSQDIETAGSLTVTFDDFIEAFFDLKSAYWATSSWLVSRQLLKVARKLKADGATGQYLWEPAPKDGTPSTILDRPYNVSEYIPGQTSAAWTAGVYVAAIGEWSNYWIADSLQILIQILEELFSTQLQTGFLMTKEVDGMPVLAEAFRRIKLKA